MRNAQQDSAAEVRFTLVSTTKLPAVAGVHAATAGIKHHAYGRRDSLQDEQPTTILQGDDY